MISLKMSALAEASELGKVDHLQLTASVLQLPTVDAVAESLKSSTSRMLSSRVDLNRYNKKRKESKNPGIRLISYKD